jgi:hypothetical protein
MWAGAERSPGGADVAGVSPLSPGLAVAGRVVPEPEVVRRLVSLLLVHEGDHPDELARSRRLKQLFILILRP